MSELLHHIKEFRSSPQLIEGLRKFGITKNYAAGEVIISDNAHTPSIPIVLSGTVKVFREDSDGKEILLYYITSGESCVMSFLGGLHNERSSLRAEIEDDAEILFLPISKVSDFIRSYPQWLNYIFRLYHLRFEELLEVINAVAFRKVDERLLQLLHKKAALSDTQVLYVTHEQLAKELGTARVVVSRLLKKLEENGRVTLGRNKITLV